MGIHIWCRTKTFSFVPLRLWLAETINGLYKTEVIRHQGPWKGIDAVEYATLEWVDWFNNRPLYGPLGHVSPMEYEAAYYAQQSPVTVAGLN